MANFPPNLGDGELWLPSDIFPEELPSNSFGPNYPSDSELAYVESLAHRFAALALLEPSRSQTVAKPPPTLERFAPPVQYGSTGSPLNGYLGFNGGFGVGHGHGLDRYGVDGLCRGSGPVHPYQFLNPVQRQVEGFVEARARDLRRQQIRLLHNQMLERGLIPLQRSGLGIGGVREYGGTGVFLPRIAPTTTTTTANVRRPQSVRNRQGIQVIPQGNPIRMVDVGKQEECHYHLPPDMGFPQDWTY